MLTDAEDAIIMAQLLAPALGAIAGVFCSMSSGNWLRLPLAAGIGIALACMDPA
jgi:hypothetical protein